jgi:glycosyltransferase involved in cell wall biosynthesis
MSQDPMISVIIPVYNGAGFLPECIACVRRQQYQPVEIIIVDDGSTDNTRAVASSLGEDILYQYQENRGPSAARTTGITMAKGEFIAFLDVDDLWSDDKLIVQAGRLIGDESLDIVLGRIKYLELPGAEKINIKFKDDEQTISFIHLGCALFRKTVFSRIGLFDESLKFAEDHDIFLRAREAALKFVILDQTTLIYRLHDKNITRGQTFSGLGVFNVIKRSLDRRRRANDGAIPELKRWSEYDERK